MILCAGSACYFVLHSRISFRSIFMLGLAIICPALTVIGLLEVVKRNGLGDPSNIPWGQASLVFVWSFVYGAYSSHPWRAPSNHVGSQITNLVIPFLQEPRSAPLQTRLCATSRLPASGQRRLPSRGRPTMLSTSSSPPPDRTC